MAVVDYELDDGIAVLTVNHPPVNALGAAVRAGVFEGLQRALADDAVEGIVLAGGSATFIAGADIKEIGTAKSSAFPTLHQLQDAFDACAKPTVAALHGTALGGGLELAMTCHARVAARGAKVGLPEVKLGLLPGAGGTTRLPRLVGPQAALELITSGEHVDAARALALGVVDAVVDDLRPGAVAYAKRLAAEGAPKRVRDREEKIAGTDPALFEAFRASIARKARGQAAPFKIIDCVEAACTLPFEAATAFEREAFKALFEGEQRKALVHCFFAEREARKIPGLPAGTEPLPIRRAAVVGAGLMGGGIAMVFANAGIPVRLIDVSADALARGRALIEKTYATSVSRGSMSQDRADRGVSLIAGAVDYADLGDVDIVIEAVFEDMALKTDIFARLDRSVGPHAILASNTSSLDIDQIAAATSRPDKVIGVHFFSPANVMKLQENVRGAKSSPQTISTVMALGKVPVLAGNCDGFIGNRMLQYYTGEAEYMLEEGATPEQVDRVAEGFGMAMGPLAMRDMAGMETSVRVRAIRRKTLPPDERLPEIVERLVEAGRVGQKTGKGYYRYEGRVRSPDPEAMAIIEAHAKAMGIARRAFTDEEVRDRLFMPLVNEGAKALEDGTALRAGDIDVVWVNGYGFPAHRGGPMFWGERMGLDRVVALAERLATKNGRRWAPSPLMRRLAEAGKGWADAPAFLA